MSAGELFDLIRPAVIVVSALLSTWLLVSARRRFPLYQALLIAIAAFFLPFVILPLYVALLLVWRRPAVRPARLRLLLPLLFLITLLTIVGTYTYFDERSVDAHLSKAIRARVLYDPLKAISEYREALKLEDTPHTHKLLAQTLDDAGYITDAITEYRAAELGGDPDDTIHYRLGTLLEKIDLNGQALLEFKEFAGSQTCLQVDARCEESKQRIKDAER